MSSLDDVGSLPHHSLLALVWTSFGGAFLFVGLRTAIRLRVVDRLTAEDLWMLLALATLLTMCIIETIQLPSLYYITAVLAGDIPLSEGIITNTEEYLRFEFPIIILFWSVLWSVKAGFLALYFKLFRELPIYRRIWYCLATFTLLAYAGCWITLTLSCGTLAKFFEFNECAATKDIWTSNLSVYYSTVIDVFTDLCIMAMPLRLIYTAKISLKQKVGLVCVFGLGFVMIAFAIIRAKQVLVEQAFVNLTLLMIWSTLAASISVIVGSLPALKIFVTNRASAKRSRRGSSFGSTGGRQLSGATDSALRSKSVPLSPLSATDRKSPSGRYHPSPSDSQEEILRSDGARFVMLGGGAGHDRAGSFGSQGPPREPAPPYPLMQHPVQGYRSGSRPGSRPSISRPMPVYGAAF